MALVGLELHLVATCSLRSKPTWHSASSSFFSGCWGSLRLARQLAQVQF